MVSRRGFLGGSAALIGVVAQRPRRALAAPTPSLCGYVDPFIGTGATAGHTYPGAAMPFGMVQLSPDTGVFAWESASGYAYKHKTIMGFSHTHLSGTGVGDMLDLLVTPRVGPVETNSGSVTTPFPSSNYFQPFDHKDERASPGYYSVRFKNTGVLAELTVGPRSGLHRYSFPPSAENPHLLIDWHHGAYGAYQVLPEVDLKVVGNDMVVGSRRVLGWAEGRHCYFALRVSRPFARAELYRNTVPEPEGVTEIASSTLPKSLLKCVLFFPDATREPVTVKVGISAVDIAGAIKNLDADEPGFDFDGVHQRARAAWETELGKLTITTDSDADKQIFYTAHYHALLAPTLFSDADGRYRGMNGAIHTLKAGEENYSTYSLWDNFRAVFPFYHLTQTQRMPGMIGCLVRMGQESPSGPPIWPLQGTETDCMIGYHSAIVLAEAAVKQVPGVDYRAGYQVMRKRAMDDDINGLGYYRKLGYMPADRVDEAVSRTIEISYDDWAVSKLALRVGATDDAKLLRARARNYRNVFDKSTQFMRAKFVDGSFATPFNPIDIGHSTKWRDYTETNAWQATFIVQHDIYGYMPLFGGDAGFEAKLDALFAAPSTLPANAPQDISGLVGQYAGGNEPSQHIAYLYAYAGAAYKAQSRVRMLMRKLYSTGPNGLPGNEDCGQMSAWYIFSALGFYPVDPVSGIYVIGSPLFTRAEMKLGNGKTLIVSAPGNRADTPYITSLTWNGRPYSKVYLTHDQIMAGGELGFVMSDKPNPAFGHSKVDRPPSFV